MAPPVGFLFGFLLFLVGRQQICIGRRELLVLSRDHRRYHNSPQEPHEQCRRQCRDQRGVFSQCTTNLRRQRLTAGGDGFIGQPMFDVLCKVSWRAVTTLVFACHRLQADGFQCRRYVPADRMRPRKIADLHLTEQPSEIGILEGSLPCQQVVQCGTETVHVTGRSQLIHSPRCLFRRHEGWRADCGTCLGWGAATAAAGLQRLLVPRSVRFPMPERLGKTPVHHQSLAVLAQHDVARLQIAMQNATAMRILNSLTHVDEPAQELASLRLLSPESRLAWSAAWNRLIASSRLSPLMNRMT